jgi:stearoyl-CoA desaturase (delta-9 desaturase)
MLKSTPTQPDKPALIWHNILFLCLNPIAALILTPIYLYHHGFTLGVGVLLFVTYTISNMSITCGYHRYFSHRSYDAHPIVEWLYIFFAAGAFQGSLLSWCTDHRRHHREVDTEEDPYSINKGFWFAHMGWMFRKDTHPEAEMFPKDLTKNRFIVFQDKYYALFATFVGFILPALIGWACGLGFWGGAIIGGSLRIALSQQTTFLINSAAHTFGSRPYNDKLSARDNFFLAFLTFGEGYHNFHHYFQADYRNGIQWYQWDPTKWWIQILALVGMASRLKQARKEDILKARLALEERTLIARGASAERVEQLKLRLVHAQTRMRQLRDDYRQAKKSFRESFEAKRLEMSSDMRRSMNLQLSKLKRTKREEIKMAKNEFQVAYVQWRTFRRETRRGSMAA